MRVVLIGNYQPDNQESMERFALMLHIGFNKAGYQCEIWRPKLFFAKWIKSTESGIGKWFGYIDKWILFPLILKWRLRNKTQYSLDARFHICDHSNAYYLKYLPADKTSITCHDVLAIRGSLGYTDAYCPASSFGKVFQKWILYHLSRARLLAADSQLTYKQLNELTLNPKAKDKDWRVIHVGFNEKFSRMSDEEIKFLLEKVSIKLNRPFILHVGSNLPRKNRKLLLDMVAALGNRWSGTICFAGQEIDNSTRLHAQSLALQNRIMSVTKPDHSTLLALYSACEAFIFPSFSEGFGWPVIEAQACGSPVIASNIEPMPEVGGNGALYANPYNPQEFAEAFLGLNDESVRQNLIQKGYENCNRFEPDQMINSYLSLYGLKSPESIHPCF